VTGRLVFNTLIAVIPPLALIFAVLGSIFFGFATPTEASGVGAFGATLLAALNGRLTWAVLKEVGMKTTLTTAFIFGIFLGATLFAVVMRQLGGDEFISQASGRCRSGRAASCCRSSGSPSSRASSSTGSRSR
jgi:TRAP-type mannitol/chloroaromatic compound transport system permease large subunit